MAITEIHSACSTFAREYPAGFVTFRALNAAADQFVSRVRGQFPYAPEASSADIAIIGLNDWAYSVFIEGLSLGQLDDGNAQMDATIKFTVHRRGNTADVVKTYEIVITAQPVMSDYNGQTVGWVVGGGSGQFTFSGAFDDTPTLGGSTRADESLVTAHWIDAAGQADRQRFDREVDAAVRKPGADDFISRVVPRFPRVDLAKLVPWVNFGFPLEANFTAREAIFWSKTSSIVVPGCHIEVIPNDPDPNYQPVQAEGDGGPAYEFGCYMPEPKLSAICRARLSAPIKITDGGGGAIGWSMSADGIPAPAKAGLNGQANNAIIDARWGLGNGLIEAHIDGPSGLRVVSANSGLEFDFRFSGTVEIEWNPSRRQVMCFVDDLHGQVINVNYTRVLYPLGQVLGDFIGSLTSYGAFDIVTKMSQNFDQVALVGEPLHIPPTVRSSAARDTADNHSFVAGVLWHGEGADFA